MSGKESTKSFSFIHREGHRRPVDRSFNGHKAKAIDGSRSLSGRRHYGRSQEKNPKSISANLVKEGRRRCECIKMKDGVQQTFLAGVNSQLMKPRDPTKPSREHAVFSSVCGYLKGGATSCAGTRIMYSSLISDSIYQGM